MSAPGGPEGVHDGAQHEGTPVNLPAADGPPRHPGRPTAPRRIGVPARSVRHIDAAIEPGVELFAFAEHLSRGFGGCAALLRFAAVPMRPVAVHVPEPDPSGAQIMRYGPAVVFDGPSTLIGAQMTIGFDAATPTLHAHGHLLTADGRAFGGHLARGGCVVDAAARPVPVRCAVYDGVRLEPGFDGETGFALLTPVAEADRSAAPPDRDGVRTAGAGRMPFEPADRTATAREGAGWVLRLKPDEDLVDATAAFAAAQGLAGVRVLGGVGSLMRATLARLDGTAAVIDGPGVEVVTVEGELDALRLVVADLAGAVHAGRAVAGGNPICVTIELFLQAAA